MVFKVGQTVEVIDKHGMVASLGATAVVTGIDTGRYMGMELIDVKWITKSNNQCNGGYQPYHFKPMFRKHQQLLFSFMNATEGT